MPSSLEASLDGLLTEVRACRVCASALPLGPRPIVRGRVTACILIAGQAPGVKVHQTGVPWNDPSGDRLRAWMQVDRETFYDEARIAIIPTGFCYPGRAAKGDLPPRKECAQIWLPRLLRHLPNIRLTLLCGRFAQRLHLGARMKNSLAETVRAWREYAPEFFPLPHPSSRNVGWFEKNSWFAAEVLPGLRCAVQTVLGSAEPGYAAFRPDTSFG
ncbi:MAG TPA: uracil-DNA glycosylase family protein [Candidatus Hydrogenedentes bacterium]|nr:uracil-DNA glycosylase family protein [Candidatus Hydrogenedentota bacterium]HIJ74402.1 uracil-DNA glycosylase family protein [Candidatus Hydrogenedentota bacterium]